jgi:hypothetical protein
MSQQKRQQYNQKSSDLRKSLSFADEEPFNWEGRWFYFSSWLLNNCKLTVSSPVSLFSLSVYIIVAFANCLHSLAWLRRLGRLENVPGEEPRLSLEWHCLTFFIAKCSSKWFPVSKREKSWSEKQDKSNRTLDSLSRQRSWWWEMWSNPQTMWFLSLSSQDTVFVCSWLCRIVCCVASSQVNVWECCK